MSQALARNQVRYLGELAAPRAHEAESLPCDLLVSLGLDGCKATSYMLPDSSVVDYNGQGPCYNCIPLIWEWQVFPRGFNMSPSCHIEIFNLS